MPSNGTPDTNKLLLQCLVALNAKDKFSFVDREGNDIDSYALAAHVEEVLLSRGVSPYGESTPAPDHPHKTIYIHLYNGRSYPEEELDDWGTDGPTFGPYEHVQTTYGCHVKCQVPEHLIDTVERTMKDGSVKRVRGSGMQDFNIIGGEYLYYDGVYYGDWIVYSDNPGKTRFPPRADVVYDSTKTRPPETGEAALPLGTEVTVAAGEDADEFKGDGVVAHVEVSYYQVKCEDGETRSILPEEIAKK